MDMATWRTHPGRRRAGGSSRPRWWLAAAASCSWSTWWTTSSDALHTERECASAGMLHATNTQGSRAHDTGGRVAGDIGGVSCVYIHLKSICGVSLQGTTRKLYTNSQSLQLYLDLRIGYTLSTVCILSRRFSFSIYIADIVNIFLLLYLFTRQHMP